MSEYPILFSGEMVKAILARKKTQTRRVINNVPEWCTLIEKANAVFGEHRPWPREPPKNWTFVNNDRSRVRQIDCPQEPGDRLWVKEKCAIGFNDDSDLVVDYHADGKRRWFDATPENQRYADRYINDDWRRSARFMPHWASRITLEVVNVRAERLKGISEEDAKAEGVTASGGWNADDTEYSVGYRTAFSRLWDSINGKRYPWSENPWTWVIEFKPVEVKS